MLEKQTGTKLLHIPYKGAAEAMTALVAGQIDSAFGAYEEMKALIDAGKLRPVAVFSKTRSPALPNVPTMTELGVPIALDNMKGLMAPAGLPEPVYRYLNDAFRKAVQTRRVERVRGQVRHHGGLRRRPGLPEGNRRSLRVDRQGDRQVSERARPVVPLHATCRSTTTCFNAGAL